MYLNLELGTWKLEEEGAARERKRVASLLHTYDMQKLPEREQSQPMADDYLGDTDCTI